MPTNRRFIGRKRTAENDPLITQLQRTHALEGCCLINGPEPGSCYCGLRVAGVEDEKAIRAIRRRLLPDEAGELIRRIAKR